MLIGRALKILRGRGECSGGFSCWGMGKRGRGKRDGKTKKPNLCGSSNHITANKPLTVISTSTSLQFFHWAMYSLGLITIPQK